VIPDRAEIVSSLIGAWRLFRFDPDAMRWFDTTMEGFWRSFFAAVLALPSFVFAFTVQVATMEDPPEAALAAIAGAIAYAASWVAFPVVAAFVVRPMGYGRMYVPYIVAHNWTGALVAQAYLVVEILIQLGIFAGDLAGFVKIILFAVTLWYAWRVARVALDASVSVAGAMVVLAFGLDLLIGYLLFGAL
jgi:hypothetical protein